MCFEEITELQAKRIALRYVSVITRLKPHCTLETHRQWSETGRFWKLVSIVAKT